MTWGIEIINSAGETMDMDNAYPLQLLDSVALNTGAVVNFSKTYDLPSNATIYAIPDSYWGFWKEGTTHYAANPVTITVSGHAVTVKYDDTRPSGGGWLDITVMPTRVNIFAIYTNVTASGWGIWESVGGSYPSMTIGTNSFFYKSHGTASIKSIEGSDSDGMPYYDWTDLKSALSIADTDLCFWRIKNDYDCFFYCQATGNGCLSYDANTTESDWSAKNIKPYYDGFHGSTEYDSSIDYIIFSQQTVTTPVYGIVIYAQDGTPCFSNNVAKPFNYGGLSHYPSSMYSTQIPCPYGANTFYACPPLGWQGGGDEFLAGVRRRSGGTYIDIGSAAFGGGAETTDGATPGFGQPFIFIDGTNYGF